MIYDEKASYKNIKGNIMSSNFSIEDAHFPDGGLKSIPMALKNEWKAHIRVKEKRTIEDILSRAELIYKDFLSREDSVFYSPLFTFGIAPFLNSLIDMDPGKANGVYAILQAQTVDEEVIKNPSLKKGIDEIFDWYKSLMLSFNIELDGPPSEFLFNYWAPLLKSMNFADVKQEGKSVIDLEKTYLPGDIHNWKVTQYIAEIMYGVALGTDYDHRTGEASMYALLESLRYLENINSGEEASYLKDQRKTFEKEFDRLDNAWDARHEIDHKKDQEIDEGMNRKSLSALANVGVKTVVNAQLREGKPILLDENDKVYYTLQSSLDWLMDTKKGRRVRRSKYFETLLVPEWKPGLERIAMTIPANNKQQLKMFIKDVKEELGIDQK
tara:strand:+ start:1087 stop:2235 length:1149 start_codon:yes stop_codon:yes gene_type:complete